MAGEQPQRQGGDGTYVQLRAEDVPSRDAYRLMTDIVAPRPIAWVSTLDAEGKGNLAPFSYYQAVCSNPPTVVLGFGWRSDGRPKDTLANILARGELTINHVDEAHAKAMNVTSADVDSDVNEWSFAATEDGPLVPAPSFRVTPPRIASAHAAFECKLVHAIPLGRGRNGAPSSTLVIAEVVGFVVRGDLLERDDKGRLRPMDPGQLASVGRLGGIAYTTIRDRFELARPSADAMAPKTGPEGTT